MWRKIHGITIAIIMLDSDSSLSADASSTLSWSDAKVLCELLLLLSLARHIYISFFFAFWRGGRERRSERKEKKRNEKFQGRTHCKLANFYFIHIKCCFISDNDDFVWDDSITFKGRNLIFFILTRLVGRFLTAMSCLCCKFTQEKETSKIFQQESSELFFSLFWQTS